VVIRIYECVSIFITPTVRRSPLIRPYQRISMHDATSKLVLCPPPSDAMSTAGPPLCPCGLGVVAPSRSLGIRERWAEEEGISWSWVSSSTRGGASVAYFRFCAQCHTKTWPDDRRHPNGNRCTRPARRLMPTFQSSLHGRQRLVTGDLYITESPPEYVSAEAQAHVLCMVTKCQGCGFVGGRPHKAK